MLALPMSAEAAVLANNLIAQDLTLFEAQFATFADELVDFHGTFRAEGAQSALRCGMHRFLCFGAGGMLVDQYYRPIGDRAIRDMSYAEPQHFLRFIEERGPEYGPILERRRFIEAYDDFTDQVAEIHEFTKENGSQWDTPHPAFLGAGNLIDAYTAQKDHESYAILTEAGRPVRGREIDRRLQRGLRAEGNDRLAQLTAISYFFGAVVLKRMTGQSIGLLTPDQMQAIGDNQLTDMAKLAEDAFNRKLAFDAANAGNFLFDETQGLGVVDLNFLEDMGEPTLQANIISVAEAFTNADATLTSAEMPHGRVYRQAARRLIGRYIEAAEAHMAANHSAQDLATYRHKVDIFSCSR